MATVLGVALALSAGNAFASAFPLLLPIFAAVGSTGGLQVFTSDRMKGTLEYLMAYGVGPRRIFVNTLTATLVLVTVILAVALGMGLGANAARGHGLTPQFALLLGLYGVPMSYACSTFAATVGMFWTSLSSPRSGLSSPIGIIPFIGILPAVATLLGTVVLAEVGWYSSTTFVILALSMVAAVTVVVVILVSLTGSLLRRERLLSPA
jgi:hypothetical protein